MTTLSADKPRTFGLGDMSDFPVIASDIIYEGAAVGENASGYSRPLVAGDPFQGFAVQQADNSGGSAGDITVRTQAEGVAILYISGVAITANDQAPVYASDDDTFTLTAGSNTLIGNVRRWISTGYAEVAFKVARKAAAVSLGDLDSGIAPSHVIKYAGEVTWTGGGASLAHTVTGAAATDLVTASFHTLGTEGTIIQGAVASSNTVTITLDAANTTNDAVITYIVYRAAS